MELEKENKRLKVLIVILLVFLVAFGGYYFYEKVVLANKEENNTNSNENIDSNSNANIDAQNNIIYFEEGVNKDYTILVDNKKIPIKYEYLMNDGQKVNLTINNKVSQSILGPYKLQVWNDLIVVSYNSLIVVPNETYIKVYDINGDEKLKINNEYIKELNTVDPNFDIKNNSIIIKGNSYIQGGVETDDYYIVLCEQWGETNLVKDNINNIDKKIPIEYNYMISYNENKDFEYTMTDTIKTLGEYIQEHSDYCIKYK